MRLVVLVVLVVLALVLALVVALLVLVVLMLALLEVVVVGLLLRLLGRRAVVAARSSTVVCSTLPGLPGLLRLLRRLARAVVLPRATRLPRTGGVARRQGGVDCQRHGAVFLRRHDGVVVLARGSSPRDLSPSFRRRYGRRRYGRRRRLFHPRRLARTLSHMSVEEARFRLRSPRHRRSQRRRCGHRRPVLRRQRLGGRRLAGDKGQ